jgi:hypothetical protein
VKAIFCASSRFILITILLIKSDGIGGFYAMI